MATKARKLVAIKKDLYDQMQLQGSGDSRIYLLGAENEGASITDLVQLSREVWRGCNNAAGASTQNLTEGYLALAKAGCNWIVRANVRRSYDWRKRHESKKIIITRGFKLNPVE